MTEVLMPMISWRLGRQTRKASSSCEATPKSSPPSIRNLISTMTATI
ncbi:hypothetical protein TELCIR_01981 [Teladorsagia circumcincta]|uniref:Uncharacterized protein n=1 Tax=Teladorsagia circumcincta TaxID=45464 RepID=A0A2G9V0D9_TELCI|nr:hypothetical protein TELCIR_01981 [Teladorsagia circumcincta]